jgi:uncharacterized membrane protein (DUF106 family)
MLGLLPYDDDQVDDDDEDLSEVKKEPKETKESQSIREQQQLKMLMICILKPSIIHHGWAITDICVCCVRTTHVCV